MRLAAELSMCIAHMKHLQNLLCQTDYVAVDTCSELVIPPGAAIQVSGIIFITK